MNETNITAVVEGEEGEEGEEDDPLRRRQLYEVSDVMPRLEHRFVVFNESGNMTNRTYDQVLTGYYMNVTMNISVGQFGTWNESQVPMAGGGGWSDRLQSPRTDTPHAPPAAKRSTSPAGSTI